MRRRLQRTVETVELFLERPQDGCDAAKSLAVLRDDREHVLDVASQSLLVARNSVDVLQSGVEYFERALDSLELWQRYQLYAA